MGGHVISLNLKVRVMSSADWTCQYCGTLLQRDGDKYSSDYGCCNLYIAEKFGGKANYTNLVASCRACSQIKSDLDVRKLTLGEVRSFINERRLAKGLPYCEQFVQPTEPNPSREVVEFSPTAFAPLDPSSASLRPVGPTPGRKLSPPEDPLYRDMASGGAQAPQPQELTDEELEEQRELASQAAVDAALAADPNFFNKKPIGGRVTDGSALERPVAPKPKAGQLEE